LSSASTDRNLSLLVVLRNNSLSVAFRLPRPFDSTLTKDNGDDSSTPKWTVPVVIPAAPAPDKLLFVLLFVRYLKRKRFTFCILAFLLLYRRRCRRCRRFFFVVEVNSRIFYSFSLSSSPSSRELFVRILFRSSM
jgi:hypothetical protein